MGWKRKKFYSLQSRAGDRAGLGLFQCNAELHTDDTFNVRAFLDQAEQVSFLCYRGYTDCGLWRKSLE